MEEQLFRVGLVSTAHGIRGALKVFPTTQDPERFRTLKKVRFSRTGEAEDICAEYTVQKVSYLNQQVLLQLEEVTDRNQAEQMRGGSLWIPRKDAVPLDEDEFYIADFVGATVWEEDGRVLGTVTEILQTGSNEVLAVRETSGKELLIPVIRDCIRAMNAEEGIITVHLLEGLRG